MIISKIRSKKLITAIKTPYTPDNKIDFATFDKLVNIQYENNVQGLIIGGTTGEGHLLDWPEHLNLIKHAVKNYKNKLTIIGNTGSNNTAEAFEATSEGFESGMDASLQINPYYGKTSHRGLVEHFNKLLNIGPAIIYNVPGRTAQDIDPAVIKEISTHKNFIGVKECAGNQRIGDYFKNNIFCWSGNDEQAFDCVHSYHGLGVISVTANVIPKLMFELINKPDNSLNEKLAPLIKWLFSEPNPIPLNSLLADLRLIQPVFRLPYVPLSLSQRQVGLKLYAAASGVNVKAPLADNEFKLI